MAMAVPPAGVLRDYLLAVQQLLKFPSTREGLLLVRPQAWFHHGFRAVAMVPGMFLVRGRNGGLGATCRSRRVGMG